MVQATISWDELQELTRRRAEGQDLTEETCERLGDEILRCEVLQNGGLYRQLLCLRLFEPRGLWRNAEEWLGVKLGWPYKTANERLRVARALNALPQIDAAFREGRLSYTKVRAIHDVATPENEQDLIDQARYVTGSQLHKLVRPMRSALRRAKSFEGEPERGVSFSPRDCDEDIRVQATLRPEEAAIVRKALDVAVGLGRQDASRWADSAAADLPRQRFGRADALVLLSERFLADATPKAGRVDRCTLFVHTLPDLSTGVFETGDSAGVETVRRLACDGATVPVQRGPEGEVLDVGRRTRRIPPRLERALLIRDRCCRFPHCTREVLLDAHHVEHWVDGGATKLSNLVRLCRTHHRLVHEGSWGVFHREDGSIGFLDPCGDEVKVSGLLPVVRAEETHAALEAECVGRGLDLASDALTAVGWGERIDDYDYATFWLAEACGFVEHPDRPDETPPAIRWLLGQDDEPEAA